MPDPIFSDPRLAKIYDPLDPDRSDLDVYVAMVDEFGARRVLDVGCGTGTFACLLAERGVEVVGMDPAGASLDVARAKPGADRVRWILGDATTLPPLQADLAIMTGNVAQVFLTDEDWAAALAGIRAALRPAGTLVFEIRDPSRRAWREWDRARTYAVTDVPGAGVVESWSDVLEVAGPLVTFRHTYVFASDGAALTSDSTLRFRSREEVERSLREAGFGCREVRDAPDRPGRELVFVANKVD
ncbi:class I SAM-dependent methyltransferase [Nonomuraea glycinis]|uniref:class I SAM-dependent methyltransferase n=1 Tax=Nonomuraea glycinis TaxID=2047744 RepID=UPI00166A30BC|nr:class I SAM-dependent methyltransferase [Nonomuraea glycinis]MCA2180673.1 class I SAM-dependent methyltransferase [Nonomuraea glycinis]